MEISEENRANYPEREVLISRNVLCQADWGRKNRGQNSTIDDCSRIIDTGFNDGDIYSFRWVRKYKKYLRPIYPLMQKLEKTVAGRIEFVFGNQGSGDSDRAVILPIWVGSQFSHATVRPIIGDAELLLGADIIAVGGYYRMFRKSRIPHWAGRMESAYS